MFLNPRCTCEKSIPWPPPFRDLVWLSLGWGLVLAYILKLSNGQPGLRNTASSPFPWEDPSHHIPLVGVSPFSKEKHVVIFRDFLVLLSQELSRTIPRFLQKYARYLQQPFKFYLVTQFSAISHFLLILRLFSNSHILVSSLHAERKSTHFLVCNGPVWSSTPTSQALFTYSPILVLFPFCKILNVHLPLQSLISFSLNQSSGAEEVEVDMYLDGAGCKRCSCGKEGCVCWG